MIEHKPDQFLEEEEQQPPAEEEQQQPQEQPPQEQNWEDQQPQAEAGAWDQPPEAAGAWDPVAALMLCGPARVRHLFVEGGRVVRDGQMATIDLEAVVARQRRLALALMG